jgi:hypothetical protein
MLMIRPWRARSGLSLTTHRSALARRADSGTARLPRIRLALLWRRPRRLGPVSSTPLALKPAAFDVRHRFELLMRWSSEIRSFNERLVRTLQEWTPRRPALRQRVAEGRSWRLAEPRLPLCEERIRSRSIDRMNVPARRVFAAMADSGMLLRSVVPLRHFARDAVRRRLAIASTVANRDRPLGAAQLFPALKRVIAPQARGGTSLRRGPIFGNGLSLTGRGPHARPAHRFATASLALSRASGNLQTSAAIRAVRPVELAWRSNSAGSTTAEKNAAVQLPMTVVTRSAAATDIRSRIAVRDETLPSDSRAVNRLADEVLGRIERKLRVERERRGR